MSGRRGAMEMVLRGVVAIGIGIGFSVGCGGDHTGAAGIGVGGTGGAPPTSGAAGDGGTGGEGIGAGGTKTGTAGRGGDGGSGGSGGSGGTTGEAGAGGDGATGTGGGFVPPASASWLVSGGDAPSGTASAGGVIHVVAQGAVTLGASVSAPPPALPPPANAFVVDDAAGALAADVTVAESIRLDGGLDASGAESTREITSTGGDIFVAAALRSGGGPGSVARGLTLRAPSGTVYVTGTVDASGTAAGQSGGPIVIAAQRVVVTGAISTSGAAGPNGGQGGTITISASDLVLLGAPLHVRGGAGMTAGGSGGALIVDTAGAVQGMDLVDARGGAGVGVGAVAGASGAIRVGERLAPSLVNVAVPLSARGGTGGPVAGAGGNVTIETKIGKLVVAGSVDFSGGDAAAQPGDGGAFVARVGIGATDFAVDGGAVVLAGRIAGDGGGVVAGGSGNGGVAGLVDVQPVSLLGALTVMSSAVVTLDGGGSGGAGIAGGGGHLFFITKDGDLTVAGNLSLRGGDAPDPGGTGGLGGAVDIFSDADFDGVGGNLLIDTTGVIDASGGNGTIGGSGRNNGTDGVASFPDGQEMIAVLINCDGKHGSSDNWLENRGLIISRGGAANGNGGDIIYHGISPDRDSSPPSGNIDNAASGTGRPGDYGAE